MRTIGKRSVASVINVVLGVVRIVITFTFAGTLFATLALPFFTPNLTVVVPVSFRLENMTQLSGRPDFGFQLPNEKTAERAEAAGRVDRIDGSLRIPTRSRKFIAVNAVMLLVIMFVVMLAIDRLRAVMKTLIFGSPFVPENATRIRFVALAILAGELARSAVVFAENHYAASHVAIAGVTFDAWPRLNFSGLISGLIILVIAEVFRVGTRLDEEQSLTV